MPRLIPTFCRVCESQCGLVAEVEGADVRALRPDPAHPVSRGYACRKGTGFGAVHTHPDRVLRPLLREGDALVETPWERAFAVLGARLRAIREEHGPEAIGLYLGNAAGASLGAILGAQVLQRAIGTTKAYSCLTLDNSPMFVVTEACLGNPLTTFVADYAGADLVVLFGTDPLGSQPSQAQSNPGGNRELRDKARAGRLVVVDPRASVTARAGEHVRVRPGSDVVLLAYLVREALRARAREPAAALPAPASPQRPRPRGRLPERRGSSSAGGRQRGDLLDDVDLAGLAAAVERFGPERVAAACGVDPRPLAARLLAAERPLVWSGLGVLLGPDGTLGYWLTLALQAVLGGLDRAGGWLHQRGAVDLPALLGRIGLKGSDPALRSRVGGYPAVLGTLAAATLADDALTPGDGQLRALIVVGGNPAVSLPDSGKAARALAGLDLLVSVDLFVNATGRYAHAVLPAADWLEREEVALQLASQRRVPHLQVGPAVVPPRGEARGDWAILCGLAAALGGVAGWGARAAGAVSLGGVCRAAVGALAPFSWAALAAEARGVVVERPLVGALAAVLAGRRVRLAVPAFVEALGEVRAGSEEGSGADLPVAGGASTARADRGAPGVRVLRLVSSVRPIPRMNSWIGRVEGVATLHPEDLAALGGPTRVRLRGPGGALVVAAVADAGVAAGTVVLPWGDAERNANVLVGTARLERFTGQPVSNGEDIHVTPG